MSVLALPGYRRLVALDLPFATPRAAQLRDRAIGLDGDAASVLMALRR